MLGGTSTCQSSRTRGLFAWKRVVVNYSTPPCQAQARMETMTSRSYGQFCGFARALELVGERWALLVVRDLVLGPKRFTDLRRGLPRIPTNILSARLKELEDAGVVRRRVLPRPAGGGGFQVRGYG